MQIKRKINISLGFLSLLVIVFTISVNKSAAQQDETRKNIQKLASVIQIIDYAYVDTVNLDDLVENVIVETLKELDPHSVYVPKKELDRTKERLEGSFEGIGVSFQIFHDTILVIAPVPGGPSEELGIMAGDKIIKIDGEVAFGEQINNQFVMDHLRGKKGSKVIVSIYRKGVNDLIEYTIIRDKIPINSIDAVFMAAPGIGCIKLNRFQKTTMEEFRESLQDLKDQGMEKLILDLRGNAGGYLGIAIDLADEFLPDDKLIVYTQGSKSPKQDYKATSNGGFEQGELIIMIDEGSASASEIVSGAVQDWDRGLIIGRRSFGKGLVQRPFPLIDGSVVRLTTARYYTPTGRSIQRPYDKGKEQYYKDIRKRWERGELIYADSIHFPDSLKYYTPNHRVVYGGGGIMPDIFVPYDSTWVSDYYITLRRKGVINRFTLQYVDDNREALILAYPDFEVFNDKFNVDDDFMKNFIEFTEKEGVEFNEEEYQTSKNIIEQQLKSWIARNLWDVNAMYQVITGIDYTFQKVVDIFQDGTLFGELKISQ